MMVRVGVQVEFLKIPSLAEACTLPVAEQPVRVAEFGELFASGVVAVQRVEPTHLRLILVGEVEASVRDIVAREQACCSFFDFVITPDGNRVVLDIGVPENRTDLLAALADLAADRMR